MFVPMFYGRINYNSYKITFANGAHQLPIKARIGRTPQEVEGGYSVVLCILPGLEYNRTEVILETGEHLFSFTDGATEAFNVERQAFSEISLA